MFKKVLVTGGVGFIGTNLIKNLVELGIEVESIDDYSQGSKSNEIKGVKYNELDIEKVNELTNDFDLCFHLAAKSRVQPSFESPMDYFRVNARGTASILEWAKQNNTKVIYAGSSSRHHNPSDSPYAMYKYLGEEICKLYKTSYNLDVKIARFYNVYGPYESVDEKFGNVIGIWRSKIKNNKPLPIVGDGNQRRDFTHVEDIVDGLIKIASSNIENNDAWELGTGTNYSVNELFDFFKEKFKCTSEYIDEQKGNYRKTLRKNDEMLEKLNWRPKDRLREYILNLH